MSTEIATTTVGAPCARPTHETFAQQLALHGNAAAAYRAAFPDASAATVNANASVLAKHPDVVRRVAELREARRKELLERTADLEALVANLAIGKAAELVDAEGRPIPIQEWPVHVRAAVSGIEIEVDENGRVTKYKARFPSPLDAARLLAQLRGQLVNRTDVTSGGRSLAQPIDLDALAREALERSKHRLGLASADVVDGEIVDGEVVEPAERGRPKLEELV